MENIQRWMNASNIDDLKCNVKLLSQSEFSYDLVQFSCKKDHLDSGSMPVLILGPVAVKFACQLDPIDSGCMPV